MAFPVGWTNKLQIQSDPTKVSGSSNLTNFPVLIKDENLTSAVYAGLNPSHGDYSLDLELSSSQYASISDASQTGLQVQDFTFEAWIKLEQLPSTSGTHFTIVSKYDYTNTDREWLAQIRSDNTIRIYYSADGSSTTYVQSTSAIVSSSDVGKWVHIAGSVDVSAKTGQFYKAGSTVATDAGVGSVTSVKNGASPFVIGANDEGRADYFDGKLKNVRIFDDIRTDNEIIVGMNSNSITDANLKGEWNLENNYNDSSGNSNNLTASGSPTFSTDVPLGGSDLRITTDSAGTTEVPFEIVSLDTSAEECEIWAKVPTLDYDDATSLYIWYGNSSALPYASDDTYGSENVWSGDVVRYHLQNSGKDSSANAYNLSATNSPVYATGKIGNGIDLEASSSQYMSVADASCPNLEISGSQTFSFWFKPESIALMNLIGKNGATNRHQLYLSSGGKVNSNFSGLSIAGLEHTTVLSAGTIYRIVFRYNGSTTAIWINDTKESLAVTGTANDTNAPFYIGRGNSGAYGDGIFDEIRVTSSALSDDWITTEYNNQNDPSTFWTEAPTALDSNLTLMGVS